MPKLTRKHPSYRLHKPSGQAIVTLDGKDIYLGPHGTQVSRSEYDRLIGEWLSHGPPPPGTRPIDRTDCQCCHPPVLDVRPEL